MKIRIGTRNSPLALWQAREVARNLQNLNYKTEIFPIVSSGDKNLTQPLYSMGITGVFTRDLDIALLNKEIDIAVHSLKDVPTQLPNNIEISAVLERDFPQDVLVRNTASKNKPLAELSIATSSLRRRAFWLRNFPQTQFTDIRGNLQTRLQKIEDELADASIFSLAGLKRMSLPIEFEELPMMLPAPSQGVVAVCSLSDDETLKEILSKINHAETSVCTRIEREFLQTLEGGCTAPIGAFAEICGEEIRFRGRLTSLDGTENLEIDDVSKMNETEGLGERLAGKILNNGGRELMKKIKESL